MYGVKTCRVCVVLASLIIVAGNALAAITTSTSLISTLPKSGYGCPVTFVATVKNGGVRATDATGTVVFKKDGVTICTINVAGGVAASWQIMDLAVGSRTITAVYSGDSKYSGSTGAVIQTVAQRVNVTFSNSMMSMSISSNGVITSVKCVPNNNTEMLSSAKGFYIYHQKDNTTNKLTRMAPLSSSQILLWSDNGQYIAKFNITCPDRYFKIELAHVGNNIQNSDIDASWPGHEVVLDFNLNVPAGYTLQNLKMDYMTEFPYYASWYHNYNFVNIHWQNVQYSQPATPRVVGTGSVTFTKTVPEPMGAVGFYLSRSDAEHDDILAQMWSSETCMVRPNQDNLVSWTKADIWAWLDRYERELTLAKTLAFVPSGAPNTSATNEFYKVADKMYAAGFDTLLLWNCWGGYHSVDSINTNWFAGGVPGMKAFKDYCAQRGIRLNFHAMSGFVTLDDPLYGAVSPTGLSPQISRWATGTLLNDIDSTTTTFSVMPDYGCQILVHPAPWSLTSPTTSIYYPPYYMMWGQGLISIGNDILYAKATEINPATWSVTGNRNYIEKYGQLWGMSHKAGTRVDFLTSYYGQNTMVDSRSDLLINVAERFASGVVNMFDLVDIQYDGNNVNQDLGNWGYGKYATYVQKNVDHPVNSSYAGNVTHGHFEDLFIRIQKTVNPGNDYPTFIRTSDSSFIAPSMDEINFAMGQAVSVGQKINILGGHIGCTLDMINTYGLWDQAITNLNVWIAVAPYLTEAQKKILGPPQISWGYDFYEPTLSGRQWLITPKWVMARTAVDEHFFNMQEFGAMSPRQFNKVGETVSGLTNKYDAQTPEIELYVLPAMNATDSQNVSLMPASANDIIHPVGAVQPYSFAGGVIYLAVTNNTSSAIAFTPGTQDYWNFPIDMTSKRGLAVTVTGDNSGAQLVFKIKNGGSSFDFGMFSRDYVVTIDFTGQRTIEIPNGEVMWHRKNPYGFWSDYSTIGFFDYRVITGCQVYMGRVPANTTARVQISAIKAMKEDRVTGLVNPTLRLNNNGVYVAGTIPYNHYLVYSSGNSAKIYDKDWHYIKTLTVGGPTLTANAGSNNTFSVTSDYSPNTWLTTRIKTRGTPWVVGMPSMAHEWRWENNTQDSIGTAHGTAYNSPAYVSGNEGAYALSFNGVNQYVRVPDAANLRFTSTNSFTLSAWVKLNSLPNAWAGIANKGHSDYGLWITPENKWACSGLNNIVSPVTATSGQWHLITAVQDGVTGLRRLYVDGTFMSSGWPQSTSGSGDLCIGCTSGSTPSEFLNGAVDDVRLYNAAMSGSDIKALFISGNSEYTVTAISGAYGAISPSGAVRVERGASQVFTITPNAEYTVAGVTVDGVSVGAVTNYVFSNVATNHSITATFKDAVTYFVKANNATKLDLGGSWVGGVAPAGTDFAVWAGAYTAANLTNTIASDVTWGGIQVLNVTGAPVFIANNASNNKLYLKGVPNGVGCVGIDMSSATVDMTIGSYRLYIQNNELFTVAAGRKLTILNNLHPQAYALTLNGAGNYDILGQMFGNGSQGSLVMNGTGTLNLNNANYLNTTILSNGVLSINHPFAVNGSAGYNLYIYGGSLDSANDTTLWAGTCPNNYWYGDFTFKGTKSLNMNSGGTTYLGGNRTVTVTANTLTIGTAIGDSGSGYSLTKAGAGTLALTGTRYSSGKTIVKAGTLSLNNVNYVPTTILSNGVLSINHPFAVNGSAGYNLYIYGGSLDSANDTTLWAGTCPNNYWYGDFTFKGTKSLNMNSGGTTYLGGNRTVTVTANTLTIGAPISDSGNGYSLAKSGAGTLVLTGASTYKGATIVNSGTLKLTHSACLSTSTAVYLVSGATIDLAFAGTQMVHALYVNGLAKPAGTYNQNNLVGLSGSGNLQVIGGDLPDYTMCAAEGQTVVFTDVVDVAYGANGSFSYKYGVTGSITFNNATFGDPIPGVVKKGYYKIVLPSPWVNRDIGAVAAIGSASYASGLGTVKGSGADIWNAADEFQYVYQPVAGNVTVVARVTSIQNVNAWSKAGVMVRETLNADSRNAMVAVTPSNGITYQRRTVTGGTSTYEGVSGLAAPYWIKLVRSGNIFTAYRSPNGTTWTQVGTAQTITMSSTVYVGIPVTSHQDGTLCTATFDNISVQ